MVSSLAAVGTGIMNNKTNATAIIGIPIKISGLALPARDGFLSINLPTSKLPTIIMIEEANGITVSSHGAQEPIPITLCQYWTSQMLTTPLQNKAKIGPNK